MTGPSAAGSMVLLGVADWPMKPAPAPGGRGASAAGSGSGRGGAAEGARGLQTPGTPAANEKADVDVWHWTDTTVMSAQKLSVGAARSRNLPAVWHMAPNKLVVAGKSNREIAADLVISQRTAESHIEHILSKLGFNSRTQIAVWFADQQQ